MRKRIISTLAPAALAAALFAAPAAAQDVKIGGLFAITGPIASLVPPIVESAKLAVKHVNEQGGVLKGSKLDMIIADGACNPQTAAAAAKKLVHVAPVVALTAHPSSAATVHTPPAPTT